MNLFIDLIERFRQNILFYNKKLKIVTKNKLYKTNVIKT